MDILRTIEIEDDLDIHISDTPLSYLNMIPRVMFGNPIKAGVPLLEMMRAGDCCRRDKE